MLYKAKVGNAYVKNIYTTMDEIQLTHRADRANYFKEDGKEYLLRLFPDAEIKVFEIVAKESDW